jgi:hypothetical protein
VRPRPLDEARGPSGPCVRVRIRIGAGRSPTSPGHALDSDSNLQMASTWRYIGFIPISRSRVKLCFSQHAIAKGTAGENRRRKRIRRPQMVQ